MKMMMGRRGCTQIPISTLSHVWVFVRLYGIVYVIIVIIIIIVSIFIVTIIVIITDHRLQP